MPVFKRTLALRLSNLTKALKAGQPAHSAIPDIVPAVVNLSNAHSACEGSSAAVVQPAHALAFLPVVDAASGRQLLLQVTMSAEKCGTEPGLQLKFDVDALRELAEHAAEHAPSLGSDGAQAEQSQANGTARQKRTRRNGASNGHPDVVRVHTCICT